MGNPRRNLLTLLLVFVLVGLAVAVIQTKETKQGLDLKGGVSLIYEAKPTQFSEVTPDSIQRSIDIMRERVDALGVAEPEIARAGQNQIEVQLPGVDNVEQAIAQVGTTAQLLFYDWEPNVMGPGCKPAVDDPAVTGGQSAGNPGAGSMTYFDAVQLASTCTATNEKDDLSHDGSIFYGVDTKAKKVRCGPQDTEADLREACENDKQRFDEVVEVPRGYVVVQAQAPDGDSKEDKAGRAAAEDSYFVLKDDVSLKGTDIKDPNAGQNPSTNEPNVNFSFTDSGKDTWEEVTREIAQRGQEQSLPGTSDADAFQHFAIVLDDQLISVPYIDFKQNPDGINASNGSEISGNFTIQSAQNLANLLKTGALPIKLELISQSEVSATLGQQALDQGLTAALAGFLIVALFLIIFYRVLGLIAVGALAVYALYLFALIKLIPITLTLPGIAGVILTIGVAADANIVIFERVKEEARAGRSTATAIAQGYKKGLAAIIDANVVTILVAFILFMLATAGVKGFALTLGLGTITSLFTAVLATQAVLGSMGDSKILSHRWALGASENQRFRWKVDFMGKSKWFFSFSGLILVVCAFALSNNGLNLGIDFESGTRVKTALTQNPSENEIREALTSAGFEDPKIQRVSNDQELGGDGYQISLSETGTKVGSVKRVLETEFGASKNYAAQSIGPTFGQTIAKSAITAIIASLIVISIYVTLRFEWKFAVPVLIATAHDLLITAGVYALTDREVTTSTVAALLTVLGFSLYDTIIVFDRVRENVPRMPQAAFSQIVNRSLSEVLTRSLATSFCALLPLLALYFFGGDTLQDFAFALIIGTLSGTYSSVFIATPVLTHWKETETMYRRRRTRVAQENGGVVPAYATGASATEVAVGGDDAPSRRLKRPRRVTTPDEPAEISKDEFDELVAQVQEDVAPAPEADPNADASSDDLVMKDEKKKKPKGPRNRRHGRR